MQWKDWKDAWKLVKKGSFTSGFVVSNAHLRFVIRSTNIPATNISVLEAGVVPSDDAHHYLVRMMKRGNLFTMAVWINIEDFLNS